MIKSGHELFTRPGRAPEAWKTTAKLRRMQAGTGKSDSEVPVKATENVPNSVNEIKLKCRVQHLIIFPDSRTLSATQAWRRIDGKQSGNYGHCHFNFG